MKTTLKIILLALCLIIALKLLPFAIVPAGFAAGLAGLLGLIAVVTVLGFGAGVIGLVLGMLALAIGVLLFLSPLWIPILAVVGLVSLLRRTKAKPAC